MGPTACGLPGAAGPRPAPAGPASAPAPGPPRPAPHFLRPLALTSFSTIQPPLPPPPAPPQRGGHQVRPGTGPQAGGPGLGSPAGSRLGTGGGPGSLLVGGRGREVLGSLQVGRARPAGRGGNQDSEPAAASEGWVSLL